MYQKYFLPNMWEANLERLRRSDPDLFAGIERVTGRLDGRVAIITGAARGQGAAEAELFVAEGARVVVTDVDAEGGEALADRLGGAARFEPLDVRDEAALDGGRGRGHRRVRPADGPRQQRRRHAGGPHRGRTTSTRCATSST